jgi:CRP-like cAMP-binding protein
MNSEQYFKDNNFQNTLTILESSSIFTDVSEAIGEFIQSGYIQAHKTGTSIIQQDSEDKDVYFILKGSFGILSDGNSIASQSVSDILGEMSIVDSDTTRTATAIAQEDSVVLHVEDQTFISLANKYPTIWRNIASEISKRLRKISGISI